MTLAQKQQAFAQLVVGLIRHAALLGHAVTLGEAWRSPEEAARLARAGKGIKRSLHCDRLAVDLNLFVHGQYQPSTEAHRPLGEWWEAQSTPGLVCAWGGRFGDGNHYSIEHEGRK